MLIICTNAPVIFLVAIPFLGNYYMNVYMWTIEILHFIHGTCISISIYIYIYIHVCMLSSVCVCIIPVFCLVSLTEQIHIEPVCDCHRHCWSYWSRTSLLPPDLLSRYELHPAQSLLSTVSYPFVNYSAPLFFLLQPQAFFTVHCSGLNENVPQCLNTWFPVG